MFENLQGDNLKEEFKNNKTLRNTTFAIGGVIVVVIGYFLYNTFVWKPSNEKSMEAGYIGLNYADKDSSAMAIDELRPVVKKYDGKKGGEVAQFVMARQMMEQGEFEAAIKELKAVKIKDTYVRVHAVGLQGDCFSEMKEYEDAVSKYKMAAEMDDNQYTTPQYLFKAGLLLETKMNEPKEAAEVYQSIKDGYDNFSNTKTIDRYIERAKNKIQK